MSGLLVTAALILFAAGVVHSVLGEMFILSRMDSLQGMPSLLGGEHGGERALRAAWHGSRVVDDDRAAGST
jgi:hypothetical protein